MAVPAENSGDLLALHGLVARNDVLDIARQQVAVVREAVGERRAVVKDVFFGVVAGSDRFVKGAVFRPVLQYVFFESGECSRAAVGHIDARVSAACGSCFSHGGSYFCRSLLSLVFFMTPTGVNRRS